LQLEKLFETFRFHEIKKDQEGNLQPSVSVEVHESFTANIGVKVRGVRVVRGKFFEN
jgi:hypothetical protein